MATDRHSGSRRVKPVRCAAGQMLLSPSAVPVAKNPDTTRLKLPTDRLPCKLARHTLKFFAAPVDRQGTEC